MHYDQNTSIHNRRYFFDTAPSLLAEARDPDRPGILAVADLDHFKRINDTHSHAAGDLALRALTRVCAAVLPEGSLFCRIGGEEFVIPTRPLSVTGGMTLLNQVRAAIADHRFAFAGKTVAFTVSLGATPVLPEVCLDDLLRAANTALYRAKRSGRNQIQLATAGDATPP